MKYFLVFFIFLGAFLSAEVSLDHIFNPDPSAQMGIEVVSLKSGQVVYKSHENSRFIPSSSLKLFTVAAALDLLGKDFCFETEVVADGKIKGEKLKGNCYLIGSGDPSLRLKDLEEMVSKMGEIKVIEGDLILDLSLFDAVEKGPGWMWDEGATFCFSPMGALNVDHNCVRIGVKSGSINMYPSSDYVKIESLIKTGEKTSLNVWQKQEKEGTVIGVEGEVKQGEKGAYFTIPVKEPHFYVAQLFKELLESHHIKLKGEIKCGKFSGKKILLASHTSPPLMELINPVLKDSDNFYANCLFKKIGTLRKKKQGSFKTGASVVYSFLKKKVGIDPNDLVIVDGDGQSRYNLVSPHQMVKLLMWLDVHYPDYKQMLSISGVDGCLKNRMKTKGLCKKVRAKTGTMTGTTACCGYLKAKSGEELAFALFTNGHVKKAKEMRKVEDAICAVLTRSF